MRFHTHTSSTVPTAPTSTSHHASASSSVAVTEPSSHCPLVFPSTARPATPPQPVLDCVAACPETTFIAHGPGFWRYISGDAETAAAGYPDGPVVEGGRVAALLEALPNLHADLSAKSGLNALQRDPAHGRAFLLRYHDRLLFGRDGFGSELHEFLQSLELPAEAVENIYHRNAERLLRRPT